jgi:hypothetical protein
VVGSFTDHWSDHPPKSNGATIPEDQVRIKPTDALDQPVVVPPSVISAVTDLAPGSTVRRLRRMGPPPGSYLKEVSDDDPHSGYATADIESVPAVIADDDAIAVFRITDDERARLAEAGALVDGEVAGRTRLAVLPARPEITPMVDAVAIPRRSNYRIRSGLLLVTPEAAARLGLTRLPDEVVVELAGPLSAEQRTALGELAANAGVAIELPERPESLADEPDKLFAVALGVGTAVAALVMAIGLLFVRVDRFADPVTGRSSAGRQAYLLALIACPFAVLAGWIPLTMLLLAGGGDPLFPVEPVVWLVVVVPTAAGLVGAAGGRAGLWLRPLTEQSGPAA